MIGVLQRLGHRETVLSFLGWSVFAVIVMHVAAAVMVVPFEFSGIPVYTAIATIVLGVMMGRDIARRGVGLASTVVALNALPVAIAGTVLTAVAPQLGWPLLVAPACLGVGAATGIAQQRRRDGYQNPGSAAAGAAAAFAVFAIGTSLALGAMDARFGQGITEIYSYLAEYDCLDPQHARLADAIHSLGSENNRQRIDNAIRSGARPCKP